MFEWYHFWTCENSKEIASDSLIEGDGDDEDEVNCRFS